MVHLDVHLPHQGLKIKNASLQLGNGEISNSNGNSNRVIRGISQVPQLIPWLGKVGWGELGKRGMIGFVRAGQTAENEIEHDVSSTTLMAKKVI